MFIYVTYLYHRKLRFSQYYYYYYYFLFVLEESQRFLWTGRVADERDLLEDPGESRFC